MPRRFPGARRAALYILVLAACCAAPVAGLRIHEQQPEEDGGKLLFFPSGLPEDEPPPEIAHAAETPQLQRESGRLQEGFDRPRTRRPRRRSPSPPVHLPGKDRSWRSRVPTTTPVPRKPLRRVIFAPRFNAGFDSSFSQIYGFMQLGMLANAGIVFHPPKDMLSPEHGSRDKVAEWWDTYLEGEPKFYSEAEVVECERERWELQRFVDEFRLGNASVFFNHSQPLCIDLIVNWYRMRKETIVRDVLDNSGKEPLLYASKKIRASFVQAQKELGMWSGGNYSVVHVRQGDMGAPNCTSPESVAEQMQEFGPHDHWLLASNANESWFQEVTAQAELMKLNFTTEHQGWLGTLEDNYFRYCLLKCAFGGAERFLGTYKHAVFQCAPVERGRPEQKVRFLCEESFTGFNGTA